MSCWVTFAWTKRCQTQSNIVKRCQMLQAQNSWRLKNAFVFRFSDQVHSTPFNSIQLHSTPFNSTQLHSTPFNSIQLHSTPFNSIQLHSTPFNSIQLHSTPFNSIQLHSTQFNSIQLHSTPFNSIQLHSTPLKHHVTQTTALIQSRLHPREATIRRSHLEKNKRGCCDGNCSRLINELVLTKILAETCRNYGFDMDFYHKT